MRPFHEHTHFVGFDWAWDHHDAIILDRQGVILEGFQFDDTAEGWQLFRNKIAPFPAVAVAIETSSGPAVDRLLEAGCTVYPLNSRSTKSYRQRKAPSGVKDDQLDCWAIGDGLRTDGHAWRPLRPEDPLTLELRLLCRDERALIEQRTALINQLQAALHDYYPAALEAFDNWTLPSAWAFVEQFSTPLLLQTAGKRKWEKFLHANKLSRPENYQRRLEIFARAADFCGSAPTTAAKSRMAMALAKLLRTLQAQLDIYEQRIQELYNQHPDKDWFGTLPIPKDGKTAPRLLSELGTDRQRFDDAQALQCYAGSAPIRFQSGQIEKVYMRRACNKDLRYAAHWFADLSRNYCSWAAAYYSKKRADKQTHAGALRALANRWMKIIWKMWQTRTPYDAELHQRNQLKHGSWVLSLAHSTKP